MRAMLKAIIGKLAPSQREEAKQITELQAAAEEAKRRREEAYGNLAKIIDAFSFEDKATDLWRDKWNQPR